VLQKLEINALRGATRPFILNFEKGKTITILYGENGTGKSTICDSLELLAKGKLGSLVGKGIGKTEAYWHSTGKKPSDLSVALTSSAGRWEAKLAKSKVFVNPELGRPQVEILRRSKILSLISEEPKDRYSTISPFIDISPVEQCEEALRKLLQEEKKNRETAAARIEENRVAVENFWKEAGIPGSNALVWARSEIAKDASKLEAELEQLETLVKGLETCDTQRRQLTQYQEEADKKAKAYEDAVKKVREEEDKISNEERDLVGILEAANTFFYTHESDEKCPLCGSPEFAAGLSLRVAQKLEFIRSLTEALRFQSEAQKASELAVKQVARQKDVFINEAARLSALIKSDQLPSGVALPSVLFDAARRFDATALDANVRAATGHELCTHGAACLAPVRLVLQKRRERKGVLQNLRRAVNTYDTNFTSQKELDTLLPHLEQALVEMSDERRRFVDDILRRIATKVGEYYEEIHPGEGLSKISLLLDPDKRASLEILGAFPGTDDAPPGAYFSDSHLDSLGLCIFLALTELRETDKTILVLDDVVASADEPHVERVIELLYKVAGNYQHCILTTHYRPWREKYRWGWLRNGQCHFVELVAWDHAGGIKQDKALPPVEELRTLLTAGKPSPQLACASAGVILEAILDFLTRIYECSVPRRKGKLTLGDLLPSVKGKLRATLKIERMESGAAGSMFYAEYLLGPILEELEKIAQARNVFGCHFNELARQLPEADAIRFAETVLKLADYVIDSDFGWPGSDKSGSYWANPQQTRRLHPLKQPS
jgi:recombinational DNA repair ATPase RecF